MPQSESRKSKLGHYLLVHMIADTFRLEACPAVHGPSLTPVPISALEPSKT